MPTAAPSFVLPYEPNYAGHRDAARRRAEVVEALKRNEQQLRSAPYDHPIVSRDAA